MSIFLKRQKVRQQKKMLKVIRRVEKVFVSLGVVLGGLVLLSGGFFLVFSSPCFSVQEILVKGLWHHIDADQLAALSGVEVGSNLFRIDMAGVQQKLHANPWVRRAAVRRHPPHTLYLYIEEYEPVAIVAAEGKLFYVDREGVQFKGVQAIDDKGFPVLTGMTDEEQIRKALLVMGWFDHIGPLHHAQIAEINFKPTRGLSLTVDAETPIEIIVGEEEIEARLRQLKSIEDSIWSRGSVDYIVANDPERIVVKYRG